jgi:hypothetical protein
MKKALLLALLVVSSAAIADEYVQGYYRHDGTYVQGYYRTESNNTKLDNYSTQGNTNPYTGQQGTVNPYSNNNPYTVQQPTYPNHQRRSSY